MFELRNENEVEIIEPMGENKLQIKKCNFEKESYELCNEYTEYEYGGKKYPVVNGEFEIEAEPALEPEPTEQETIQAEILLNQAEIIAKQKEHDEVLAELLLGQQEVQANV